jgi:transmembrane sensor
MNRPMFAAAASVVAAIGLGWTTSVVMFGGNNTIETTPVIVKKTGTLYESAVGEQSTIRLPDGSVVKLNTKSLMAVEFSDTERKVVLMRGEGHFQVSADPARPFVVKAGNSTVRVIGTAFNVFMSGANRLEVAVEEGIVSVHSPGKGDVNDVASTAPLIETILSAGEVVAIGNRDAQVRRMSEIEMANRLSWQTGMVMFEDERLASVLVDLQRYTATRLLLEDKSLGDIRVAGYFKVGDVDALMIALRENFDIISRREAPNTIILSRM